MRILVGTSEPLGAGGNAFWRQVVPYSRLGPEHQVIIGSDIPRGLFLSADVVCLARVSVPATMELLGILRENGIPTCVDFDDNIHTMHADNGATIMYSNGKEGTRLFEQALPLATVVTTSTPRLAADYAKWRSDIRVCPNFMPDDIFERLRPERIDGEPKVPGEIRVGYAGGRTHLSDLRMVAPVVRKLCKKYPEVRIVCFGQNPPEGFCPPDRLEYHAIVMEEPGEVRYEHMDRYFTELRSLKLDVAIAPLVSSVFNAGKSYLKALEYGACGYPVVASSFGPYREYAGAIALANDEQGWLRELSRLVEDRSARRILAERNLDHVHRAHGTATAIFPWLRALDAASACAVPL